MPSPYDRQVRETLARLGLIGKYAPNQIEAFMRVEHPTLDGLSRDQFTGEVALACECIATIGPDEAEKVAESMGLGREVAP